MKRLMVLAPMLVLAAVVPLPALAQVPVTTVDCPMGVALA